MKLKVAQESSRERRKNSENDLKIKHVNVHNTIGKSLEIIDFLSSEGELGALICIEQALGMIF